MLRLNKKKSENASLGAVVSYRKYELDWLRVIVLGLLILYHASFSFQPWAAAVGINHPQNDTSLTYLWDYMSFLNIWRMPILFLISGMSLFFALKNKQYIMVLKGRTIRILTPYIFGVYLLSPIICQSALLFSGETKFASNFFGHLWFLKNIYIYVLIVVSIVYILDKREIFNTSIKIKNRATRITLLYLFFTPVLIEALIIDPKGILSATEIIPPGGFPCFANTLHGWIMGFICFVLGYIFSALSHTSWQAFKDARWLAFSLGLSLCIIRVKLYSLRSCSRSFQQEYQKG